MRNPTLTIQPFVLVAAFVAGTLEWPFYAWAGEDAVNIAVIHGTQTTYKKAASAMADELKRAGHRPELIELPKTLDEQSLSDLADRLDKLNPQLIATGGSAATQVALTLVYDKPIVFFMIPNALDASFLSDPKDAQRVCGVAADVDPEKEVSWMFAVSPEVKKLVVLHSKRTAKSAEVLKAVAQKRGLQLTLIRIQKSEFMKAVERLHQVDPDGAIMIPDATIYNSQTVQRLLLWGLRYEKTVFAFSSNVVKAGALAGIYSDPTVVGRDASAVVARVLAGESPEKIGTIYPSGVQKCVNERTAEMVGLSLNDSRLGNKVQRFGSD